MTSGYTRVETTLAHREPDRIPFDLGGTIVSGINIRALRNLCSFKGWTDDVKVQDVVTQMAELPESIAGQLKVDVKNIRPGQPSSPGLSRDYGLVGEHYRLVDEFGMGWQMPQNGGLYYDLHHSPLAGMERGGFFIPLDC